MQCALFPTSSEDFPPLSQMPARELLLPGNTLTLSGMGINMLSPCADECVVVNPSTRGMLPDHLIDNKLVLFPAGRLSTPPGSNQMGLMEVNSIHIHTNLLMEGL